MNYKGVIIEESLKDKSVLDKIKIISTKVEKVVEKHQTPWLLEWTLHSVEIEENKAKDIAKEIGKSLDYSNGTSWYADYKNDDFHYIIFKDKIFKVNLENKEEYKEVKKYGISLGIPEYQVDFDS